MNVCDHLVKRFWAECEFQINWFSVDTLEKEATAKEALDKAVEADLIVYAVDPSSALPLSIHEWTENWLEEREDREGALVDLLQQEHYGEADTERLHYLREAAHRAGMDYLTREPESLEWAIPDSLDAFAARAQRVTHTLDEILHTQPPPPVL